MAKAYLIKMATKPLYERNFLPDVTELKNEQPAILQYPISEDLLVSGPAGSGKTILAVYRFKAQGNKKGELLTYANILKNYLTRHLTSSSDTSISTITARGIFEYVKQVSGITVPWNAHDEEFVNSANHSAQWSSEHLDTLNFIIADETQDFHSGHLDFIAHYAERLTLFADDAQTLYDHGHSTTEIIGKMRIDHKRKIERKDITGNYRNQPPVAELANPFYKNRDQEPLSSAILDGEPEKVRIFIAESEGNIGKYIIKQVQAYIDSMPDKTPKVGILVQDNVVMNKVRSIFSENQFQLEYAGNGTMQNDRNVFGEPDPIIMTMFSAKGLEFDYVVIPFLNYDELKNNKPSNYEQIIFTAITRARRSVAVFISENQKDFLDKIKNIKCERYKI